MLSIVFSILAAVILGLTVLCCVKWSVEARGYAGADDVRLHACIKIFSVKIIEFDSDKIFRFIDKISKDDKKLLVLKEDSESKNPSESDFKGIIGAVENMYKKSKSANYLTTKKIIKGYFKRVYKIIRKTIKKFYIDTVDISIKLGLPDAALTAVASGAAYSVISILTAFAGNYFTLNNIKQNVIPDFSENNINADIFCIIEFRPVNIIYGGLCVFSYSAVTAVRIIAGRIKNMDEHKEMKGSVQYG